MGCRLSSLNEFVELIAYLDGGYHDILVYFLGEQS